MDRLNKAIADIHVRQEENARRAIERKQAALTPIATSIKGFSL